jgi:ribokinase
MVIERALGMVVVVFGSINMDLVARTPRLPMPAETITGHQFFTAPGGKGANQAVAAARLGTPTKLNGRVGNDRFGRELCQHLENFGVDTSAVFIDPEVGSGVAIIAVDDDAQNSIILIPGANGRVSSVDVNRLKENLKGAKTLLLQLEVPLATTITAARLGQQMGVTVILDPAPARALPKDLYALVDIITPNEVEASQLVNFPVQTEADAARAADVLLSRGTKTVIIKMGALGAFYATRRDDSSISREFIPAFNVNAIDTVAAGDAFNGGLATALIENLPLPIAVRWGSAVGALSTTKLGAQPSMPRREELNSFLREHNI